MATGRIGTNAVLTTRWSKAPAGGTTSLSGLDDNSVSLVYSVGYEQVYLNGALLSRGSDYTATNGTTITLTNATVAGDIVEVFANATVPLTDTYSQTVANGKFINNTLTTTTGDIIYASAANTPARLGIGSTDQVLTVSGGIPSWATPSSGAVRQVVTGATTSSQNITSTSYTDVTNLTVTITPSSTSSTILIIMGSEVGLSRGGSDRCQTNYQLLRNSTSLDERTYQHIGDDGEVYESNYEGIVYKDSPATTSAITYKIQGKVVTSGETMVWASIGTIVAMELV